MIQPTYAGVLLGLALCALASPAVAQSRSALPERVTFLSADGKTTLTGYVFAPEARRPQVPAVVMMHGRGGAYSSLAHGNFNAATLTQRHQAWGRLWAAQGYLAIMVDGFGPRGFPQGFSRGSYDERPDAVDEVNVRPLDAFGALGYLRKRNDVLPERIALQGWSNGGSAALVTMTRNAPGAGSGAGFRGALAFYPGCGLQNRFPDGLQVHAPVRVFQGSADEEVSPRLCETLVRKSREHGADIALTLYPSATHDFDDPGRKRQSVPANAAANADATARATAFFASLLRQ